MMEGFRNLVIIYLMIMNVVGLVTMGIDKRRAIKKGWRISERALLLIAFLGGGFGSFLGMRSFHHKTRHIKFVILLPIAAVIYLVVIFVLYTKII